MNAENYLSELVIPFILGFIPDNDSQADATKEQPAKSPVNRWPLKSGCKKQVAGE